ncbi:LytTR family DNA-binding domain-containing protein [Marinilabilia sp.]|uniref:LytR/AlgR family response regulator transcription factor n=1 Tax=Marinilabilia sp. TaxID=2021252 RepID=UPI0025BBAAB6|nr:LytTR family DNA-binding domain-containing protein [Marinilabilia sp.]
MNILIIEDEYLAVQNLISILSETETQFTIAGVCSSVKESICWLSKNKADLILLDIHLSDGLSFKIFEKIKITTPVILTTAYDQFAIKAFELNSIDYLIKPIKIADLKRAIQKFLSLQLQTTPDYNSLNSLLQNKEPDYRQRISVNYGDKLKSIEVSEIAAFYILNKSLFLICFDKSTYDIIQPLEQIEKELSPKKFFRINRQMIINYATINKMYFMSNRSIKVELKVPVPIDSFVSIQRLTEFKKWLDQ